jgi:hypothetical protein
MINWEEEDKKHAAEMRRRQLALQMQRENFWLAFLIGIVIVILLLCGGK